MMDDDLMSTASFSISCLLLNKQTHKQTKKNQKNLLRRICSVAPPAGAPVSWK